MALSFLRSKRTRKNGNAETLRAQRKGRKDYRKGQRMESLWLSFKLAGCVAAILLAICMPVAYWLAYSNWRGKFLLESLVALPLVVPPTGLGFYALVGMVPPGPLVKFWIARVGHS